MSKERNKIILLKGWLTRSHLMGYEIFGSEPERFKEDTSTPMWKPVAHSMNEPGIYFRLPDDAIHADSTLHLAYMKKRKIHVHVEMRGRRG